MTYTASIARPLASFVIAGLIAGGLITGAAAPAFARGKGPATITLSEKAPHESDSRMCMPKTTLGNKAEKSMADTICQTRADWEAQGVTFIVK